MAIRYEPLPESTAKSNMETAKEILENPAMINRSLSLGLAAMSSSQASTDSTKVDYTPLGHETNHVLISSSCPASASTAATTSSSLAPPHPEITITSPIREVEVEDEGPFTVPTPEKPKIEDTSNLESVKPSENKEDSHLEDASKSQAVDPELILKKVNQILACLNHSLEEIVANAEIKAQLLEATDGWIRKP
ncbi:hypothetical protein PIB30_083877 [Stylosanthes scabra]|uniref:Uncharacterized protein n=1 Tax=Stylosanthes scabra TaxID=79078 RepID=A0ABU6URS9_9FABA|nr:hypothetical protein [Stylosanthes scabra]